MGCEKADNDELPEFVEKIVSDEEYQRLNSMTEAGQYDRVKNELFYGTRFVEQAKQHQIQNFEDWLDRVRGKTDKIS